MWWTVYACMNARAYLLAFGDICVVEVVVAATMVVAAEAAEAAVAAVGAVAAVVAEAAWRQ